MNGQNIGIGAMLPALFNPATASFLAIGFIGYALVKILKEEEKEDLETFLEHIPEAAHPNERTYPVPSEPSTNGVKQPAEPMEAVTLTGEELFLEPSAVQAESEIEPLSNTEAVANQAIRKYMSELGKKSAAARARKRAEISLPNCE